MVNTWKGFAEVFNLARYRSERVVRISIFFCSIVHHI